MSEPGSPHSGSHTLVVQTAFLGDALLSIPLLKALRNESQNRLILLCRKGIGDFFVEAGLVDEVIEVDKSKRASWTDVREKLSQRELALVVCPHTSFRTAVFVSRLRAHKKIGFKRFFNFFAFHERVRRPMELPEALRQLSLLVPIDFKWSALLEEFGRLQAARGGLAATGGLAEVPTGTDMKVPALMDIRNEKHVGVDANVSKIVEPFAASIEPILVLAPGSVWRTKMWTKEGFIRAGQELAKERGAITVIMGSKDETALCQEIAAAIPNAVSMAGRTSIFESAQLLAVADLLICNDSGAMHLGAAAGVPIVSVFGPTVLEFGYRPWANSSAVVQTDLECRPCGAHGPNKCPLGHHNCMKLIDPERVVAAAKKVAPFVQS